MALVLQIISYKGLPFSDPESIEVGRERVFIGRMANSALVLEDPEISNQHVEIEYQGGSYYAVDNSTNGTCIDRLENRLTRGERTRLADGNILILGDYRIAVAISDEEAPVGSVDDDPFADFTGSAPRMHEEIDRADKSDPFAEILAEENDRLDPLANNEQALPDEREALDQGFDNLFDEASDTGFWDDLIPPEKVEAQPSAPEPVRSEPTSPRDSRTAPEASAPASAPVAASAAAGEFELECIQKFLQGAGFTDNSLANAVTADTFYLIGRLLSTSLQGAIQVLWARTKIKNELGLDVTVIHGRKSNPLKFSLTSQEALVKMLAPQGATYMPAEQSVDEAFRDIGAHEMAVMAGMKSALQNVLQRFNPEMLEQRLQKSHPIGANIPLHRQAKLWDLFQNLYADIEKEARDDFNHLFRNAFSKAYDAQIRKAKNN